MSLMRRCSRTACPRHAVATLTYVYADSTAVLGPLATFAEPHTYDLCGQHAERLTAPRGWEVVRLVSRFEDLPVAEDDLLAVADAVRAETLRERSARQAPAARESGQTSAPGYSGRHRSSGAGGSSGANGTDGQREGYGSAPPSGGSGHQQGPAMSRGAAYGSAGGARGPAWSGASRGHLRALRPTSAGSADL